MKSYDSFALSRRWMLRMLTATSLSAVATPSATAAKSEVSTSADTLTLRNDRIAVRFRRSDGGIEQIEALGDGTTLRDAASSRVQLWTLSFYHDEYNRVFSTSFFEESSAPWITRLFQDSDTKAGLEFTFERPFIKSTNEQAFYREFRGVVTVRAVLHEGESLVRWDASVENNENLAIKSLSCPSISHITSISPDETDSVISPVRMGREIPNPTKRLSFTISAEYPSSSGTMQFTAYTGNGVGFYADTRDAQGHRKNLKWGPQSGLQEERKRMEFNISHRFTRRPGADVSVPYTTTFGVLDGDWYDAADRYRTWLDKSGWLQKSTPSKPSWLDRTGAVYDVNSYRREGMGSPSKQSSFSEITNRAIALRERIGAHLQLRWHGWSTHGAPAGGDWFPPKEGWDAFRAAFQRLTDNDIGVMGYLNVFVGLENADWWQNNPDLAKRIAARHPDGSLLTESDSKGTGFVIMESIHDRWQARYQDVLKKLVELGANHIHLDGFPKLAKLDCYADGHDHPPGDGGNWYAKEARADLGELHERLKSVRNSVEFDGEGICDFYLPYMQIHSNTDVRGVLDHQELSKGATVIPLFQYTFDDMVETTTLMGRSLGKAQDHRNLLRLHLGRGIDWGALIMFRLPVSPDAKVVDQRMVDYLSRIAWARTRYANRFLARGSMLRQPVFESQTVSLPSNAGTLTSSALLGSAWRPARDREVGIVLTNVAAESGTRTTTIKFDAQPFDVPQGPRLLYTVSNGTYELIATDSMAAEVDVEVEQEGVTLLVVSPSDAAKRRILEQLVEAQKSATEDHDVLEEAKRKFEEGKFETAQSLADEILKSEMKSETPKSGSPTHKQQAKSETTATEGTGFTASISVVSGLIAGAAHWIKSFKKEEDK